jgi:hypothetical protein
MVLDEPAVPATKSKRHVREVSALGACHAVLASFLLFAPPFGNAETVQIIDDRGGLVVAYQMQWAMLAPQRVNVQIAGPCVSACTILLGYIPRERICVSSTASLGFHLATPDFVTQDLVRAYPLDIRLWIAQHGGLTHQIIWLQAPVMVHLSLLLSLQSTLPNFDGAAIKVRQKREGQDLNLICIS